MVRIRHLETKRRSPGADAAVEARRQGGSASVFLSAVQAKQVGFLGGAVNDVAVALGYAYEATANGLQAVDISDSTQPTLAGRNAAPGSANSLALRGSYAYVSDAVAGVQIIGMRNEAPTGIVLSRHPRVAEHQPAGTVVGLLSGMDADVGDHFTYEFVSSMSFPDNAAFAISGDQLLATRSFNYERKSSYRIRVRSTDQGGLFCEQAITIRVTDVNEAPTGITLTHSTVLQRLPAGTLVGKLVGIDLDAGSTLTYTLIGGAGSRDNAMFSIMGVRLRTAGRFDYATQSVYKVRARVMDQGGLWFEKAMVIGVTHG